MDPKLRDGFIEAAAKATVDTRAHGLMVVTEALNTLKEQGVTVVEDPDREAFRKRVLPQTEAFVKAHPGAKPIVDLIQSTSA
jgi:TRAP-type transport system periplasmic protein